MRALLPIWSKLPTTLSSRTARRDDPGPRGPTHSAWVPALRFAAAGMTGFGLLTLAACSQKPAEAPVTYLDLDCAKPFEAQAAAIRAQPHMVPAPDDPAEPYTFTSSADGKTSYLITKTGAPGHPAIMMQKAKGSDVVTTGCPYGDRKGYDQLHAYLDSLKHWTREK